MTQLSRIGEDRLRFLEDAALRGSVSTQHHPPRRGASLSIGVPIVALLLGFFLGGFMGGRLTNIALAHAAEKTALQAQLNEEQAKRIALEEEKFKQQWKREAQERETWRQQVAAAEHKRAEMRRRQIERIEAAIAAGEIFDATLVLLNFAEELQQRQPDDPEALRLFIAKVNAAIGAARQARAQGAP